MNTTNARALTVAIFVTLVTTAMLTLGAAVPAHAGTNHRPVDSVRPNTCEAPPGGHFYVRCGPFGH